MGTVVAYTGNMAAAEAMRQIDPEVCAAYPITPSTEIMQIFAQFVADGQVGTELVTVESEHSAMSACVGAAAAGGRVMTATSAQGLAFMWEMLYVAASLRLPMVMAIANRALNAPLNIHADHSDTMGARDSGWIQLYSENAQEAYDSLIQAVRIGEHPDVLLPVMVCYDGFIVSHTIERMELLEDEQVKRFIGEYKPLYPLLAVDSPITHGPVDLQNYYTEHKRQQVEAMKHAKPVITEVGEEYGRLTGRHYGLFEKYRLDDAELGIVVLSAASGTTKEVVDELRERGVKAGVLKLRTFRPFPAPELAQALSGLKAVAVLDRSDSFGAMGGPVFIEVRSALLELPKPPLCINYIYGLGGRDLLMSDVERVYSRLDEVARTGKTEPLHEYLTVRT